ncbi:UNVERIFIED_CONTAM: hypothetical protein HDU68_005181 [Siphonaria sp. JEL0065]|nr:hypothetical protein HDU68_005181 [Siphonaria sp. JEL0065]
MQRRNMVQPDFRIATQLIMRDYLTQILAFRNSQAYRDHMNRLTDKKNGHLLDSSSCSDNSDDDIEQLSDDMEDIDLNAEQKANARKARLAAKKLWGNLATQKPLVEGSETSGSLSGSYTDLDTPTDG